MPTKKTKDQLESENEKLREKIIKQENDIINIKNDKVWNFLFLVLGIMFFVFVIIMRVPGNAVQLGFKDSSFAGNDLFFMSFLIMFGNRIFNMFGKIAVGLASVRLAKIKNPIN